MRDKLNIKIRLADFPPVSLNGLTPQEEVVAREAERQVNKLWQAWCSRWRKKSSDEVMALVAYRFAELYFKRVSLDDEALKRLGEADSELEALEEALGAPALG